MNGNTLACLAWLRAEKSTQLRPPEEVLQVQHIGRQERRHRLDMGARLLEQLSHRFDRGPHLGVDRQAGAGIEMQADLQALGLERAGAPVDVGNRQAHVVARIGLGQLGQQ
jgi:hypothetical protein